MPIDRVNGPFPPRPAGPIGQGGRGPRPTGANPAEADRIELSGDSRLLRALVETALDLPDVRAEQVERFREAIARNLYTVDGLALARALLEFEDGLYG